MYARTVHEHQRLHTPVTYSHLLSQLRWDGRTFDDNRQERGNIQPRNICMLARYGNKGTITTVATEESYGSVVQKVADDQNHWYGHCSMGSDSQKNCCSNAFLLQSGFDWDGFAKGNSCAGDSDKDRPLGSVYCVFDTNKLAEGLKPPKPFTKITVRL